MSHIMQPPLPPLFALPPGACAFLHARNVPVSAAPENCAMAMVGDSIAICMSYVAPPPLRHHHDSLCTVVKLQSPVPTVPDSLFDTLVSPLPVESSTSHSSARSRYVSPSKRKKKRLKREFRRLSSIDDTVFNTEDVPELRPVTYVSTAFIYLENVGISGDESPSASDISGDELDVGHDDCASEEDEELLPSDPRSSQYLDYLYLKGTEIASTEQGCEGLNTSVTDNLCVQGINVDDPEILLNRLYERDDIPFNKLDVVSQGFIDRYPHVSPHHT